MNIREWTSHNTVTMTVGAVVALTFALGLVAWQFREPSLPPNSTYFWDLGTNEVFVVKGAPAQPPIEAPSGAEGVRAHLFSCGSCASDEWFGYLEIYSPQFHEAKESGRLGAMPPSKLSDFLAQHRLIRPLDEDQWMPHDSPAGKALRRAIQSRCDSPSAQISCTPGPT